MKVVLTEQQKADLTKLWFIFGNGGKKYTLGNHRYIQCLLEDNQDYRKMYVRTSHVIDCLSAECIIECDKILDKLKIGDKVSITTDAIDQGSQMPMNKWRGKIVAIEQNSYIVYGLGFRLPFAGNELTII